MECALRDEAVEPLIRGGQETHINTDMPVVARAGGLACPERLIQAFLQRGGECFDAGQVESAAVGKQKAALTQR